ncbi:hypothetical protein NEHOM01_1988 [Nematocida homosporus]|uniref:uncharacterized protein n=1 Tax=Nematocida homosporus TaxID=1912981 RepID=UPI00221FA086|nr:uncharacterized protein NEHOM01_1988 [Nematocida homosporus]KAI5187179.1 hypothetical protein NEHOM01_1988 [Nematocida homosporus]
MHPPLKVSQLETALLDVLKKPVVVSGPAGCGKTFLIRSVCAKYDYDLVLLDSELEWSEYRLNPRTVYLLRVAGDNYQIKKKAYHGIVFETESPYLYKQIQGAVHVRLNKVTQRAMHQKFLLPQVPESLHKAGLLAKLPTSVQHYVIDEPDSQVSFFHLIGKILYRKKESMTPKIFTLLEQNSVAKVLEYLHENAPAFYDDLEAFSATLESISDCLDQNYSYLSLVSSVYTIWKSPKYTPKKFYQIRSSSYFH